VKVTHGFVSFTEVEAGHHRSYNEWHLFDHMPEQFPLAGVVFGQRWVLTPELRTHMHATAPLDRTHYFTLYLLAEPIQDTLRQFRTLAVELREKGRFHEQRTAHLFGPLVVNNCVASPSALVSAEAVPYRPNRGVHVSVSDAPVEAIGLPGVAGAWTFNATSLSPPELQGMTLTVAWLDEDAESVAPELAQHATFSATFAAIDPLGSWDWFEV